MRALNDRHLNAAGMRAHPSRVQRAWEQLHGVAAPLRHSSKLAVLAFVLVAFIAHYLR